MSAMANSSFHHLDINNPKENRSAIKGRELNL
jgi:hypothetical protein